MNYNIEQIANKAAEACHKKLGASSCVHVGPDRSYDTNFDQPARNAFAESVIEQVREQIIAEFLKEVKGMPSVEEVQKMALRGETNHDQDCQDVRNAMLTAFAKLTAAETIANDYTADYDTSIHSNPDAVAWAKFFADTCQKNSFHIGTSNGVMQWSEVESWMITWFANAMMAQHDHLQRQINAKGVAELVADHPNLAEYVAGLEKQLLHAKCDKIDILRCFPDNHPCHHTETTGETICDAIKDLYRNLDGVENNWRIACKTIESQDATIQRQAEEIEEWKKKLAAEEVENAIEVHRSCKECDDIKAELARQEAVNKEQAEEIEKLNAANASMHRHNSEMLSNGQKQEAALATAIAFAEQSRPQIHHEPGCTWICCEAQRCACALVDGGDLTTSGLISKWEWRHGKAK